MVRCLHSTQSFDFILNRLLSEIHEIVSAMPDKWTLVRLIISGNRSYPRNEDDEQKTKNVWLKGHTGTSPAARLL